MKNSLLVLLLLIISCHNDHETVKGDYLKEPPELPTHELIKVFVLEEYQDLHFVDTPINVQRISDSTFIVRNSNDIQHYEFDIQGNLITTLGKQGRGPGEFLTIHRSIVSPNGDLHIFDQWSARQSIFRKNPDSKSWELIKERVFKPDFEQLKDRVPDAVYADSGHLYQGLFYEWPGTRDELNKRVAFMASVDTNLRVSGEISEFIELADLAVHRESKANGTVSMSMSTNQYFKKAFMEFNPASDEWIFVKNNDEVIYTIDYSGKKHKKGELPVFYKPLSEDKLQKSMERIREYYPNLVPVVEELVLEMEPYFKTVKVFDSHLWVHLNITDESYQNMIQTDLTGAVVKAFSVPENFSMEAVISDTVLVGVMEAEDGRDLLVCYRLKKL